MATFQRNWLREAHEIAQGKSKLSPKREHIIAVVETFNALANNTEKLRDICQKIGVAANKAREKKGLPPLSTPE